MNVLRTTFLSIAMVTVFAVPMVIMAQAEPEQARDGYKIAVDCKGDPLIKNAPAGVKNERKCTVDDFIAQINKIVSLLLYVGVVLAVISFIYAGFKMITSAGNEESVKHAKYIFTNVVIGLALAYGAWIIVNFILETVGIANPGYSLLKS